MDQRVATRSELHRSTASLGVWIVCPQLSPTRRAQLAGSSAPVIPVRRRLPLFDPILECADNLPTRTRAVSLLCSLAAFPSDPGASLAAFPHMQSTELGYSICCASIQPTSEDVISHVWAM